MKCAVVGLGEFGRALVRDLARAGVEVIAIDRDMDAVDDVKNDAALAVRLDATDEKDLRSQGVHEVDVLVAAMGGAFEANELLVMLAKRLGVRRVVARAGSPMHAKILRLIGADDVLQPEEEAAARLTLRILRPTLKEFYDLGGGVGVSEIVAPLPFHGKSLEEIGLRKRYDVNLIAVRRAEAKPEGGEGPETFQTFIPKPSERILRDDRLLLAGTQANLDRLDRDAAGLQK
jgi:trk system potassium uptake protein TrkA